MLLSKWTRRLLEDPNLEWARLYAINLGLMKWKGKDFLSFLPIFLFQNLVWSHRNHGLFQIHRGNLGCLVGSSVRGEIVGTGASLSGRWKTQDVIPLLMAFEVLTTDQESRLIDSLARVGILQIKHLDEGRCGTDLKWHIALDQVCNIQKWL